LEAEISRQQARLLQLLDDQNDPDQTNDGGGVPEDDDGAE
jgi:hypothetical protein